MDFDKIQALYWWLTHHHEGQGSVKYKELCRIADIYRPGYSETGPTDQDAIDHYNEMCDKEGCKHEPVVCPEGEASHQDDSLRYG
jgi:hypothetical protein